MSPPDIRRAYKRPAISDQQRRRELTLKRQEQARRDVQLKSRGEAKLQDLASTLLYLPPEHELPSAPEPESSDPDLEFDLRYSSKLRGPEARKWFARQLMLPEWMIDVPHRLSDDWSVFARPAGKRCFVVSYKGATISRQRNGTVLHRFPSALPNGSRVRDGSGPAESYSILDCIFHEMNQTYYVIDIVGWKGQPCIDCTAEFRFFWLRTKLAETGAFEPPSQYHRYRFSLVPVHDCDQRGLDLAYNQSDLDSAYAEVVPYIKDGLLFYNKHAHYQTGNTPLALVWKDQHCSQYVIDTDNKGQVPSHQQIVLELQDDGKVTTSDDPPVVFGCLNLDFVQQERLHSGYFLRFAIGDGGLTAVDGKLEKADLHYLGKSNRARAFADTYSKVMFQYMVRRSPLQIDDLKAAIASPDDEGNRPDVDMAG